MVGISIGRCLWVIRLVMVIVIRIINRWICWEISLLMDIILWIMGIMGMSSGMENFKVKVINLCVLVGIKVIWSSVVFYRIMIVLMKKMMMMSMRMEIMVLSGVLIIDIIIRVKSSSYCVISLIVKIMVWRRWGWN